ncbi:MAG: bacillithiol biosynthesis cysteine-adding enzyme BshC [Gemmatimonadales bacterium]|nr:bacillithiol biosynthesis cysteine-adding enzyme BshC [Gemmatimonadales bacterium]
MRIVATPLALPGGAALAWPVPRPGDTAPGLEAAIVAPHGHAPAAGALRMPGALVVTTGQQPGLFTGPFYTLAKAISAAALARLCAERWGRPVVPVFWSAGDDHDLAEAATAAWPAADGALRRVVLRERAADAPLTPMAREPLGEAVLPLLDRLGEDLQGEHAGWTMAWLRRHYVPGATVQQAAAGALAELLAPAGVLVLDASHPAVKRAQASLLLAAVGEATELERALVARRDALLAAGAPDPGVALGDGATLAMLEGPLGRDRLVREGDAFVTRRGRERLTLDDLRAIVATAPERLSANVLLRPVVESALLPTVAYVAGPGELRYLALCPPVYDRLHVPRQLPVARWSGVLVDPRVDRVLEKFGLGLDELAAPAGPLEARLARAQLPDAVTRALARLRSEGGAAFDVLEREAAAIDPTMERPVQQARRDALAAADEVEAKLVKALKRRSETVGQQLARARVLVAPEGKAQERVLTSAPLLARLGPALVPELLATVTAWYRAALEGRPAGS